MAPLCAAYGAALLALPAREAGKVERKTTRVNPVALLGVIVAPSMERSRERLIAMGTHIPFPCSEQVIYMASTARKRGVEDQRRKAFVMHGVTCALDIK